MKQLAATIAVCTLLAGGAGTPRAWCADEIAVGGTVRDLHGTPLLGTLVQLLGRHAVVLAQTVTDDHGRYSLRADAPGDYQLRASGAFLFPATLSHLNLRAGTRVAADLTMMALFEAAALLPAEKRTSVQPGDDWRWTLRSIANRPLLRFAEMSTTGAGNGVSGESSSPSETAWHGQLLLEAGDGGFGRGRAHQEVTLSRAEPGDAVTMFKADLESSDDLGHDAGYILAAGLQHDRVLGGQSRTFVNLASFPDLHTGGGSGVRLMRAATTNKLSLGDEVSIDAGTMLTVEEIAGDVFVLAPYFRLSFQPSSSFRLEYHLATDKALQGSEDLDGGSLSEGVLADASGHAFLQRALHQELTAVRTQPRGDVSIAVYRDNLPIETIQGEGLLPLKEAVGLPIVVDAGTQTVRVAVRGYTGTGFDLAASRAITPMLLARFDGQVGTALGGDGSVLRLTDLQAHLRPLRTAALSGSLTLHRDRGGTVVRVHYRWQSTSTLTQINEFDNAPAQAFLGFDLRQRLCRGHRFHEVEAVLDGTNVLRQDSELALAPEGQGLHLTQEPRSIQGGLAFSF